MDTAWAFQCEISQNINNQPSLSKSQKLGRFLKGQWKVTPKITEVIGKGNISVKHNIFSVLSSCF